MDTPLALRLLVVVFLVACNAFFVAAEFVLVSIRPTRLRQLEQEGHSGARTALRLHGQIDRVLSATQLGITLASLGLGWVGEQAVSELIMPVFAVLADGPRLVLAHGVAIAVAFLIITALHLVLGEVVPKNVALGRGADRLALMVAPPMDLFMHGTRPFLHVMDAVAAGISRLFGAAPASYRFAHSPEELKMLLTAGIEGGVLSEQLESMIHGMLDLDKMMVREIMVPRPDIRSISAGMSPDEVLRAFIEHQHSRLPVYERSPEHFIGVLYAKDVFRAMVERNVLQQTGRAMRPFRWRTLVRPALIVPETKPLDQLLAEFKQHRRHIALVVDEFGSIAGLVTVVDILKRIVGEFAERGEAQEAAPAGKDMLVLEGSTHIHELAEQYEIELPREKGFETVAGFVMTELGRVPKTGEFVTYGGWRFTVREMDGHRIAEVRVSRVPPPAEATGVGPAA